MHRVARAARYAGGAAVATINLGRVAARSGRFAEADGLYREALEEFEQIGSRSYQLETKARLAELRVLEGRHAEALELGQDCLADEGAVGVVRVLLERMLGYAFHQARRTADALPHLAASVSLAEEVGSEYERAVSQKALADVSKDAELLATSEAALARLQQRRIAGTLPARPPTDKVELQLDDPTLTLPVYWLGRSFDPAGALPRLDLVEASVLGTVPGTGPGNAVKLDYSGSAAGHSVGVTIDLWQPDAWQRFRATLLGRLVWDSDCARKTTLRLPDGHADIFEGYGTQRPLEPPCPSRPPDRVLAHVYLHGIVAAVDMPYCFSCAAPPVSGTPYETVPGMTAIAKGLRLRPH
jgi:hypothetical protein